MSRKDPCEWPLGDVSPDDTRTELGCGSTKMAILYLEETYETQIVDKIASSTRMNRSYIEDARNWVSMNYYYRFLDEVVKMTGDRMAPFEAGTYAVKPKCFGAMAVLLLRLGTVQGTYSLYTRLSHLFCRVATWGHVSTDSHSCTLSVRLLKHNQDKNNCLAMQGALVALPELHGCPRATIRHTQCACDGHPACVYELSWIEKPAQIRALAGALAGLCVGFVMTVAQRWESWVPPVGYALGLAGYLGGRIFDYSTRLRESYAYNKQQSDSLEESMKATEALNESLQQQVEERTKALKQANADLRESRKKELAQQRAATIGTLAAGMAHELNTPLNTIQLGAQGLRNPSQMGDDAELVANILRAARRCSRIVGELLTFSREPQTVSSMRIHQVVEGSLAVFDDEKPEGIQVVREIQHPPPMANVDGAQMQQVLHNLLSNASDAMERKGQITVRLREEDGCAVIDVEDRGPGVPEERQSKIFEPFESTKRSTGIGLGLGLSIAAELVTKNNGNIGVKNNEASPGACFTIRIPLADSESTAEESPVTTNMVLPMPLREILLADPEGMEDPKAPSSQPAFSADAIDLLLVEDDKDAGQTLRRMLERHDIRVTHFTSGKQCIENFTPEHYNAVVTDVLLGDMTGIEVLRAIRQKDERFPVIVITGHDSIASAIEALRLGAQDYIRKPLVTIQDIVTPVRKAVDHYRLECLSNRLNAELAASEVRFRSLSELLPETVFEANTEGKVMFLNAAGKSRFGITDEMLGNGFYLPKGVVPDDEGRVESTLIRVLNGETISGVEFTGLSQSGETFPILSFSTPIHSDKDISGVRAIVVDISKQKEFENELLRYQNMLRQMDSKLQVTEERERCKLAGDLHDSVAQLLVAAKMHIGLCFRELSEDGRSENLETANRILADALQQTRSLVFELSPPSLYSQGLQAGLEDLAGHMLLPHRLHVTFNRCEDPIVLDEAASVNVFRAVRELLINVSKHASVDTCVVTVSQQADRAYFTVEDQGCGFDPTAEIHKDDSGGFGIFSIRERLKTFNGSLDIQSEPGKGTKAIVSVAL